jgi:hypothetical protein
MNSHLVRHGSECNVMAGVTAGLVTAAEVNTQPSQGVSGLQIAQWSTIWFVVAIVYLVGIYYGMIHIRSSAS